MFMLLQNLIRLWLPAQGVLSSRQGRRTHSALRTLRSVLQRPARPCNVLVRYARHAIRREARWRYVEFPAPGSERGGAHRRYRTPVLRFAVTRPECFRDP